MPKIYAYDSIEELFEALKKDTEVANEQAKTHPVKVEDLKHGEIFVSPRPDFGIVVFGQVWEHSEEYPEDNESIRDSRARGYVFARCFSALCPEGELGSTHITMITGKVSAKVFERAKANGFRHLDPSD